MALRRREVGGAGTTWSRWGWVRGKTAADAEKSASVRAAKWPFTHSYSPRDNQAWRPFSDGCFPENAGPSRMLQSSTSGCTLRGRDGTTSTAHTLQPWEMRHAGLIRAGRRRILGRARVSPAG